MPTFKSGAFVQQCYSSHPLCLKFKTLTIPDRIVLTCINCGLRHRLFIGMLTTGAIAGGQPQTDATNDLSRCGADHSTELRVSAVNVVSDAVRLRCEQCRRTYDVAVTSFETYRKEV
jgi:hypothetical protein